MKPLSSYALTNAHHSIFIYIEEEEDCVFSENPFLQDSPPPSLMVIEKNMSDKSCREFSVEQKSTELFLP